MRSAAAAAASASGSSLRATRLAPKTPSRLNGIAADRDRRVRLGDRAQRAGDGALGAHHAEGLGEERPPAGQPRQQARDHRLEDRRDAGHHVHVAEAEARGLRHRVVDQRRRRRGCAPCAAAPGSARPRGWRSCEARMARASSRTSIATPKAAATESAVMSSWVGPMPPEVKTWVVAGAERVDRGDDLGLDVGDGPGLAQVDALGGERLRPGAACWCRGSGPRGSRRRSSAWRRWGSAWSACPPRGGGAGSGDALQEPARPRHAAAPV